MIFPLIAPALDLIVTPLDVFRSVYRREGHAFVPQTNRIWKPILNARKRDEVVLKNLSRIWNLDYSPTRGIVRPLALPMKVVYPDEIAMDQRYRTFEPKAFRREIMSPSGMALRVQELFENAGLDLARCHWYYRDRLVLARVDPARLEEALPQLAVAVGARFNPKTKTLDFDPTAFRALLTPSIRETPPDRSTVIWPLAELVAGTLNDTQLTALYADPKPKLVDIPPVGGRVHPVLARYIETRVRAMATGGIDGVLKDMDPNVPPKIHYSPINGPAAFIMQKGNRARVF